MRAKEEYVIVLDFLKHGYPEDSRPLRQKEAILQVLGKNHFVLMELIPLPDIHFKPHDEIYIGEGKRDKVKYIKGILEPEKLTQTAKSELPFIVEKIVDANQERFVKFFNESGPVSLRSHQLELLPGVGKKHAKLVLEAREQSPFTSFDDIKKKVSAVPNPKKLIVERVIEELEGKDRFRLFAGV